MAPRASPFHAGERSVQERAGVAEDAERLGRSIQGRLDERSDAFLGAQRVAVVAAADASGALWASPLFGEPGFARGVGDDVLELAAEIGADDPLAGALSPGAPVGVLVIDLEARRRLRVNGRVAWRLSRSLGVDLAEVFWNCPKYIQRRERVDVAAREVPSEPPRAADALGARERAWIESADTLFLATTHAERGPDASHRGGAPGFVRVLAPDRLELPDYAGNHMFQTLGNVALDARVGLAFPDLARGRVLHVSGRARIDWSAERAAAFPGAERVLEVRVERVLERALPDAPRWRLVEPSPHNPEAPAATMRALWR